MSDKPKIAVSLAALESHDHTIRRINGKEYEVIGMATHSETLEDMIVYRALGGDGRLWTCSASFWFKLAENTEFHENQFAISVAAECEPPKDTDNHSNDIKNVELFKTLFSGRDDVFAKRWENNKNGKSGYSPVCHNEWTQLCTMSNGGKKKCGECPSRNFALYNTNAVLKHLKGHLTAGVYPMFPDETCRFLALDFDGEEYSSQDDLRREAAAVREACNEKDISIAVER